MEALGWDLDNAISLYIESNDRNREPGITTTVTSTSQTTTTTSQLRQEINLNDDDQIRLPPRLPNVETEFENFFRNHSRMNELFQNNMEFYNNNNNDDDDDDERGGYGKRQDVYDEGLLIIIIIIITLLLL